MRGGMKGGVESINAEVYYAPTRGRRYLTLMVAVRNEAKAIVRSSRRYRNALCDNQGGEWRGGPDDEREAKLLRRVTRMVHTAYLKRKGVVQ
jgi:hypothetical protein